jgi:hypothetical protein
MSLSANTSSVMLLQLFKTRPPQFVVATLAQHFWWNGTPVVRGPAIAAIAARSEFQVLPGGDRLQLYGIADVRRYMSASRGNAVNVASGAQCCTKPAVLSPSWDGSMIVKA